MLVCQRVTLSDAESIYHCPVGLDCMDLTPPSTGAAMHTCTNAGAVTGLEAIKAGTSDCEGAIAWLLYL